MKGKNQMALTLKRQLLCYLKNYYAILKITMLS